VLISPCERREHLRPQLPAAQQDKTAGLRNCPTKKQSKSRKDLGLYIERSPATGGDFSF
jgi:hypothetical protein